MKYLYKVLFMLASLCFLPSFAQEAQAPVPKSTAELKKAVEKIMRENHVPGIGIAVVSHGELEWQAGIGMADVEKKIPATDETLFRIGSVSKGFVALSALKLQEEGKLKLSDTLRQWAPEFAFDNPWEKTDPVRLEHLLEHTSGLDDIGLSEYANNVVPPIALKEALEFKANKRKARWRPGSRMAYSNVDPAIVAYVIEKITGQRFEDYVKQNFFVPLHMDTATYFPPEGVNFAGQYGADGVTRLPYWNIMYRPAGAINASTRDMANYLLFYLRRGSDANGVQLLQPASIERMERCETLPMATLGVTTGYGLYNYDNMESGFRFRGHDGAVNGAMSEMMYLPEQQSGYVFMINSGNVAAVMQLAKLLQGYLVQGLTRVTPPPAAAVAKEDIDHYSGFYRNISPRVDRMRFMQNLINIQLIRLNEKGMTTRSPFGGPVEAWAAQTGKIFRKIKQPEPALALLPDEDGTVLIQSIWGTWRKVSAFSALAPFIIAVSSVLLMVSSVLFGLIWGIVSLTGRPFSLGPLSVRALPLVASVLFFGMMIFAAVAASIGDPLAAFGIPSVKSVILYLLEIAFALASIAGVIAVCRGWRSAMNRAVYWHSVAVAIACAAAAGYLLYWGAIGIPTWMT